MNNVELFTELLKTVPLTERVALFNERKNQFGLTEDEMLVAFWKADGWTDEKIEKEKNRLKSEAEDDKLKSFVADLTARNPEGNLPFGHPDSNFAKIASMGVLIKQRVGYKEAFLEVFGELKYNEILEK